MTRRIVVIGAACVIASAIAGCATPSAQLYTLSPAAGAAIKTDAGSSKFAVAISPVSIPSVVDRPQIVVTKGANQVSVDEFNRWASPLQANIGQVVAADLSALLGKLSVSSLVAVDAEFHVSIDVQAFESTPGDAAVLDAVWVVRRTADGETKTGNAAIREPCQGSGYAALAAAHSRALNHLSEDVANAIRSFEPPAPSAP
jgi:uncharacterized lipoprotein YmbA